MIYAVCHSSGQWKWRCHLSDSPKNTVIYGIKVARDNCSRKQLCIENYIKINVSKKICLKYQAAPFCVQSIWRSFLGWFVDNLPCLKQRWVVTCQAGTLSVVSCTAAPPDHSVSAVPLGQALPQCRPCRRAPGLANAATGAVIPLLLLLLLSHYFSATAPWVQHWTQRCSPKGKWEQNCSWHWAQLLSRSCCNKKQLLKWGGGSGWSAQQGVFYETHGRETEERTPSGRQKVHVICTGSTAMCPGYHRVLHVQGRWKLFPYLGNSTQGHNNCSKRQLVIEQAALSVLYFELNKFHNGNYHVTVQPKNLSMSAKGSAVDCWQCLSLKQAQLRTVWQGKQQISQLFL